MTERNTSFTANLTAFAVSEVAVKLSRLFVVIAVARLLDASAIGLAAAAIAAGDILKALTENGVGQQIIAAPKEELASRCRTAHRIFWGWCSGLFLIQASVALILWLGFGQTMLALFVLFLAGEYLFMPAGLVQAALAMREGHVRQCAAISGGQVILSNGLTVILALIWPSALVLILPRLITAPLWVIAMRRLRPWSADRTAPLAPLQPFVSYGWAVLGVEVVKALRLQADKLLVGLMMGAEILGLYFMAFNAGLSLSNSFSMAFAKVLFPHLCNSTDRAAALRQGLQTSLAIVTPLVLLQAVLAPYYVPLLLGDAWPDLSDIVAILCLAAIPGMVWTAAAGWLRANGRPQKELMFTIMITVALMLNTVLLAPLGLAALAWGYLAATTCITLFAAWPIVMTTCMQSPVKV